MLPCWLSRVFCDEGMCFYLTESVATNDMFLQYINNKHYKISPCGRNDGAVRAKNRGKDGGFAAIFSSHNIDLAVTPTKEGSQVIPLYSKFILMRTRNDRRWRKFATCAEPLTSPPAPTMHYALLIMHYFSPPPLSPALGNLWADNRQEWLLFRRRGKPENAATSVLFRVRGIRLKYWRAVANKPWPVFGHRVYKRLFGTTRKNRLTAFETQRVRAFAKSNRIAKPLQ